MKGGRMKSPGTRAKKTGAKLKRGAAVQIMCYPRPCTKRVLVGTAYKPKRSLSSFILMASLKEAAMIEGCRIEDLVPPEELQQYCKMPPTSVRVDPKRSAAAKRAWESIRAKQQAAHENNAGSFPDLAEPNPAT
jgi:hypothetical protein